MSAGKGPEWHNEDELDKIAMLNACREGDVEEVRKILDELQVDVDEADDDSLTALQIASARGDVRLAELLIHNYGANVHAANVLGYTPFLHACREGHLNVAVMLRQNGAAETDQTAFGLSALTLASAGGHIDVINFLLSLNLEINITTIDITPTPLMAACARAHVSTVNLLECRGASIRYFAPDCALRLTALHMAVICGTADVVDTLVQMGASLNELTLQKRGADSLASYAGNEDVLRYVRNYRHVQRVGQSLMDREKIPKIIERCDAAEIRKLKHQRLQLCPPREVTPLMYAIVMGKREAVEIFCDMDDLPLTMSESEKELQRERIRAEINAQEPQLELTALMIAVVVGDLEMIEVLLNARANAKLDGIIAGKPPINFNCFELALYSGFSEALRLLYFRTYGSERLKREMFNKSGNRPKELLHKILHKFSFDEDEEPQTTPRVPRRVYFDALTVSSPVDWSQPLPFVTAQELLVSSKMPTPIPGGPPTAEDLKLMREVAVRSVESKLLNRVSEMENELVINNAQNRIKLARDMAKMIIIHKGFLKPFPVGIPHDADYARFFEPQAKRVDEEDGFRETSTAERNWRLLGEFNNAKGSSLTLPLDSSSSFTDTGIPESPYPRKNSTPRPWPNQRRRSENSRNAHSQHFSSSSGATGYNSASSTVRPNYSTRSPYLQSRNIVPALSSNSPTVSRPIPLPTVSSSASMPSSPGLQSPLSVFRRGVPPPPSTPSLAHSASAVIPSASRSLAPMPANTSFTKSPRTPRMRVRVPPPKSKDFTMSQKEITMESIRESMKAAGIERYYQNLLDQEIDPKLFLNLTADERLQIANRDTTAAERIAQIIQQFKLSL